MLNYIIKRLLLMIPTVIVLSILVFVLMELTPGGPVAALRASHMPISEERIQAYKERFHLDDPAWKRYFSWAQQLLRGNLGLSLRTGEPIQTILLPRVLNTVRLFAWAIALASVIGIGGGFISGIRRYSLLDYSATAFVFASLSLPSFFLGLMGIYVFVFLLPLFPVGGSLSAQLVIARDSSVWSMLADRLHHLILPGTTLGLGLSAYVMRFTRAAIIERLQADYIVTAKAKGLSNARVYVKHLLRNAAIPVITVLSNRIRMIAGGAIPIEVVFQYPGIGQLFKTSLDYRDYNVIAAITFFSCLFLLVVFLLTDLAYAAANPKVKYE